VAVVNYQTCFRAALELFPTVKELRRVLQTFPGKYIWMASLEIVVQPAKTFHFRYDSERNGAHGHIQGENAADSLPTVVLHNCPLPKAIIRCTLSSWDGDEEHPNRLVKTKSKGLVIIWINFYVVKPYLYTYFFAFLFCMENFRNMN
jgi:hypothetical protein